MTAHPARIFGIGVLFLSLIVGCSLLDPNPGPDPAEGTRKETTTPPAITNDTIAPSIERGATAYAHNCARCHGDSAEGTTIWESPLYGKTDIRDIVHNGRRAMPSFPNLSDSVIKSIELFLAGFKPTFNGMSDRELFVTWCASCHGDSAMGTSTFSGSIQGYTPIHDIVVNGRKEMKPVSIPDSIIARIQNYLLTFNLDFKTMGGVEYYSRLCAQCHGTSGEGTTRGYEIRNPVSAFFTYVVRTGHKYTSRSEFADVMPAYTTDSLSDKQMNEIVMWLRSMQKPATGQELYARFCRNCHGTNGKGGRIGESVVGKAKDVKKVVRSGEAGGNVRSKDYMPAWPTNEITDAELDLITSHVRSFK